MSYPIYQVDAFTATPFAGNPAAVCLLPEPTAEDWMKAVAREMNLSETAFLVRQADGFDLRWFTPVKEVRLCGHATLASAHTLWEASILNPGEPARFHTLSGLLTAEQRGDWIEMDFPARPQVPADPPKGLAQALGITPRYIGCDEAAYLLEVDSEADVRRLQPDFAALKALPIRSVAVTARAETPGFDFVSRYFAPAVGVNEDPVTGSAHCRLGPFWGQRLDKTELVGFQASARGGVVRLRLAGERVMLAGQAVTVLRGELTTPDSKGA